MASLQDKVAIITGAANGIGRAAAERFAAEGAKLVLVDRDEENLRALTEGLGAAVAVCCVCDVSTEDGAARYAAAAADAWGGADVLVANAGVGGTIQPMIVSSAAEFDRVYAINVRGVWLGMRAVIPQMKARGGGSIVITSSYLGLRGTSGGAAYVASKHAVSGLMKVAALEHARDNIRVNTVNPGVIQTQLAGKMEEAFSPGDPILGRQKLLRGIPQRRYGQPQEIASLIAFLASDEASYCTGSSFSADGGQTAR
ncbi:MAG: 3alpha(or 20beta)-hydroxysteroid dehydrogenase [Myxococcota bacterium]|jgi:3alpha(or 20beta)-hydroxysteroid dehydrogenase